MKSINKTEDLWYVQEDKGRNYNYLTKYFNSFKIHNDKYVMVNGLTSAIDIIDEDVFSNLINNKLDNIEQSQLNQMIKRGYLLNSKDGEEIILNNLHEKYYLLKKNKVLDFRLCTTYSCNMKCVYCYQGSLTESKYKLSNEDIDNAFQVMSILKNRLDFEQVHFSVFGGEPFLMNDIDTLEYIFKLGSKYNVKIGGITNGYNIYALKDLFEKYKETLGIIRITLDGIKEVHDQRRMLKNGAGTFEEITKGINFLLELGSSVVCRVNLDRDNVVHISELIELIKQNKWHEYDNFKFTLAAVTDRKCSGSIDSYMEENELIKELLEYESLHRLFKYFDLSPFRVLNQIAEVLLNDHEGELVKTYPRFYHCDANVATTFSLGADGYIYSCNETLGYPDWSMGTFSPKIDIKYDKIKEWQDRTILKNSCKECSVSLFCGGGCAFSSLYTKGNINEVVCPKTKESLKVCVEHMMNYV